MGEEAKAVILKLKELNYTIEDIKDLFFNGEPEDVKEILDQEIKKEDRKYKKYIKEVVKPYQTNN